MTILKLTQLIGLKNMNAIKSVTINQPNKNQHIILIKCGGSIINNTLELDILLDNIATLKKVGLSVVIVHGGGPDITKLCNKLNIKSEFINGQRVTSKDVLDATQMALLGHINCNLVYKLNLAKVEAIGLSGHDVNLINAEFINQQELGFVGKINHINVNFLMNLLNLGITPVIAPLGVEANVGCDEFSGNIYNINADLVAAEIAKALKAHKLILLSDIDGLYRDINDPNSLVTELSTHEILQMLAQNKISGGMIPKLTACEIAVTGGVSTAHIINGNQPHQLVAVVTDANTTIGTTILNTVKNMEQKL